MEQNSNIDKKALAAIKRAYFDIDSSTAAYSGIDKVYRIAKQEYPALTRKQVQQYLQGERTYTLHKPARKSRFKQLQTRPTGLNSHWQADLADFRMLKDENKGYTYLLVCIDVLSRKLYVQPVKTKKPE